MAKQKTDEQTLAPSSRADLEKLKQGAVAQGPGGGIYRLRQLNFERHALSGALPAVLVRVAMGGKRAIEDVLSEVGQDESPDEETVAYRRQIRDYLDEIVIASVIEPKLSKADLPGDELTDDSLVPSRDYQWLVSIALREEDYDAAGNRLWGVEPLSRFLGLSELAGVLTDSQGGS